MSTAPKGPIVVECGDDLLFIKSVDLVSKHVEVEDFRAGCVRCWEGTGRRIELEIIPRRIRGTTWWSQLWQAVEPERVVASRCSDTAEPEVLRDRLRVFLCDYLRRPDPGTDATIADLVLACVAEIGVED